ncbi:unnamed protein product, partial [Onchocerca flexuosa]|uniref:Suf domain-containing protein n=1 Tax=Onchocerca flexuosa TaxID=387005 RepID=A0A183H8M3_9BILA
MHVFFCNVLFGDESKELLAREQSLASMSSLSVVSPERRIELNPFDVDAWNLLLRESQARPIDQVRSFYEKLVTQFPNAGRYWKAYIDHEVSNLLKILLCFKSLGFRLMLLNVFVEMPYLNLHLLST